MRGEPGISSVYHQGEQEQRDDPLPALKRAAWHKMGLVILDPQDIENSFQRDWLTSIANEKYGRRKKGKGTQNG